jgi:hypothetical protein
MSYFFSVVQPIGSKIFVIGLMNVKSHIA